MFHGILRVLEQDTLCGGPGQERCEQREGEEHPRAYACEEIRPLTRTHFGIAQAAMSLNTVQ